MNWSSVFCMFGMALTRPSLTLQLTSGVDVFAHVCKQKALPRALRATIMTIFSHMIRDVLVFVKCDTIFSFFLEITTNSNFWLSHGSAATYWRYGWNFRKYIVLVLLEIYFSFQQWKNFENPFKNWQSYRQSLVYYFFGTQCIYRSEF